MIRPATTDDIDQMIELGEVMWAESRYSKMNLDLAKGRHVLTALLAFARGIVFVKELAGRIIGMFWGMVEEHFFGTSLRSFDLILYVHPDHRTGRTGLALLKAYIAKAKELGAVDIMIGNTTDIDADKVGRLYEAVGFKRVGGLYAL